ncbi:MAG: metallophosphatase domain-containing protein [Deltaproteobacteria bacterium]|nr:metallophosphatase domain-containing protein [Deltaproteobacteria bacterium]
MRLVFVADTHLAHEERRFLVPQGDVFVHAGDLCSYGRLYELERAVRWIRDLDFRHKIVVAGNHDWPFAREAEAARALVSEVATYLEDSGVTLEGVKFWGSPWQPAFGGWAFNLPRGRALAEKWEMIPVDTDVLITHGPPRGFGDRTFRGKKEGCDELLRCLEKVHPPIHVFGHIHEDGGLWNHQGTTVANVTTWDCERGATALDFDVESRRVIPVIVPPRRG